MQPSSKNPTTIRFIAAPTSILGTDTEFDGYKVFHGDRRYRVSSGLPEYSLGPGYL